MVRAGAWLRWPPGTMVEYTALVEYAHSDGKTRSLIGLYIVTCDSVVSLPKVVDRSWTLEMKNPRLTYGWTCHVWCFPLEVLV
jgi:hypothetical protein